MTADQVLRELRLLGSESYKRILMNHGVREPVLGVKIEYLKKIARRIGTDHRLALALYDTGVYDAQYLAGMLVDDAKTTKKDLDRWLAKANSAVLCGFTVAAVAAESAHGWDVATKWIDSDDEDVAQTGWTTLGMIVSITDDADLDLPALKRLLQRVARTIHESPNHVRYAMNGFVIGVGCYVAGLSDLAAETAKCVGVVKVDMGATACQVPAAAAYIDKQRKRGTIGKKRKTARC
jgi:3-methyladenine DNA glycosylase AlkD